MPTFLSSCGSTQYAKSENQKTNLTFHNKGPQAIQRAVFGTHAFSYCLGDIAPGSNVQLSITPKYKTEFRNVRIDYLSPEKGEVTIYFGMYLGASNYGEIEVFLEDGILKGVKDDTTRTEN